MNFFKKAFGGLGDKDNGSSIASALILFPLLFSLFISMVDFSILMMNRGLVNNVARDTARTVSIYGGAGTSTQQTSIESAYGFPVTSDCSSPSSKNYVKDSTRNGATCIMKKQLNEVGMIASNIKEVRCTPILTTHIGQDITCTVEWAYEGLPGSSISIIALLEPRGEMVLSNVATAQSEVRLGSQDLRSR